MTDTTAAKIGSDGRPDPLGDLAREHRAKSGTIMVDISDALPKPSRRNDWLGKRLRGKK